MGFGSSFWAAYFLLHVLVAPVARGDPLVPALIIFGDSVVDVGNNNNLTTLIKANFLPYGRDFVNHRPTGRFCNGKLATDFTASQKASVLSLFCLCSSVFFSNWLIGRKKEKPTFTTYPPAYLSPDATERSILTGANFASAASGLFDGTAQLYSAISLTRQLSYYRDYQTKVVNMAGKSRADDIFSGAIHLLSAGSSDFIQNYYINPVLRGLYSVDRFSDLLTSSYSSFIQNLYVLGARRIGVTTLPPTGCLPAAITLFGAGSNQCVERLNQDAILFNNKLNSTSRGLVNKLPGLKLVVFDIYQPLLNMIRKPDESGFFESRRACCGTGTLETSLLCNDRSVGTCSNATGYVFWDAFHPSEAANKILAGDLLEQGFDLIS